MTFNQFANVNSEVTYWLNNAGKYPRLPVEVVNSIAKEIQSLPEDSLKRKRLVNKLVSHNLLLVVSFVKKFMDRKSHNEWGSPETLDYLQMGALGLIRAAEKFDPLRGYTFSTYATFWIRSAVGRYNLKTITSVHVSESATRKLIYYKRNGHVDKRDARHPNALEKIKALELELVMAYQCTSLDCPMPSGDSFVDMLPDREHGQPEDMDSILEAVKGAGVDDTSLTILRLSFAEQKTIRQISKQLKIEEERVSAMRQYALERASGHPELF